MCIVENNNRKIRQGDMSEYNCFRQQDRGTLQKHERNCLEKINMGMTITGMYRQDLYELPKSELVGFDGDFRVNMYRKTKESLVSTIWLPKVLLRLS